MNPNKMAIAQNTCGDELPKLTDKDLIMTKHQVYKFKPTTWILYIAKFITR